MAEIDELLAADLESDQRLIDASERLKKADALVKLIEAHKPRQQTLNELIKESIATQRREKYGAV
jgi:hypothetical protein